MNSTSLTSSTLTWHCSQQRTTFLKSTNCHECCISQFTSTQKVCEQIPNQRWQSHYSDFLKIFFQIYFMNSFCTMRAELNEKVIAFSSDTALVVTRRGFIWIWIDQTGRGKGDIPLKRKGATGRFKHLRRWMCKPKYKRTMVQHRKSLLWWKMQTQSPFNFRHVCRTNDINLHQQFLSLKISFHLQNPPLEAPISMRKNGDKNFHSSAMKSVTPTMSIYEGGGEHYKS